MFGDGGVDERVVVLEVCAEAEGFQPGPYYFISILYYTYNR